jgi:hypothetical protein
MPGPPDEGGEAPRGQSLPPPARQDPEQEYRGEGVEQPHRDRDQGDDRAVPDQLRQAVRAEPVQDIRQLEPHQHEDEALEKELNHGPGPLGLHPRGGAGEARSPTAEVEAHGHRRQHARQPKLVGGDVGQERREQRDGVLDDRKGRAAPDLSDQPAHAQADDHAARAGDQELERRPGGGEGAGHHRRHADAVRHQRCGVVDQSLALEQRDHVARRAQAAEDRDGGHGVRRRDDGAEHEGGRPGELGEQGVGRPGHRHDRQQNEEVP